MGDLRKFKVVGENGEVVIVTIQSEGVPGELEEVLVQDLKELNWTEIAVEELPR